MYVCMHAFTLVHTYVSNRALGVGQDFSERMMDCPAFGVPALFSAQAFPILAERTHILE